jgi:CRISPR-associated protein Csd1
MQLVPYLSRVRSRSPGYASFLSSEMDQIFSRFQSDDFTDDSSLSGEFLLGFHCQRRELRHGQEQQEQVSNKASLPDNLEEM